MAPGVTDAYQRPRDAGMSGPRTSLTSRDQVLASINSRAMNVFPHLDLDDCDVCKGSAEPGWVCEDHPGRPWQHAGCGGAGAPCACNPRGAVLWSMVYSHALRVADEAAHSVA